MTEQPFLQTSTRRNSMTSLSTANSHNNVTTAARSLSTEHLTNMDEKFMRKSIKKQPTPMLNPGDKFHKTNAGTYFFPNGEVFRPRVTPSKRHRPGKMQGSSRNSSMTKESTDKYALNYVPSLATPEIPRSSSMVSMQSANSSSSVNPNVYVSKSSSFTNLRKSTKQNLAQSLRSNKIDTPTNINIQKLAPIQGHASMHPHTSAPTMSNLLSTPVQNTKHFQLTNVRRRDEACNTSGNVYVNASSNLPPAANNNVHKPAATSSDSNLSSLSNYNLNRSSSNTPQTSINTSIDIEEAPEAYGKHVKNNENKNSADDELQKSSSLESIKENELHSIEEVPKNDVQDIEKTRDVEHDLENQERLLSSIQDTQHSNTQSIQEYIKKQEFYDQSIGKPVQEYAREPGEQANEKSIEHFEMPLQESIQEHQAISTPIPNEGYTYRSSQEPNYESTEENMNEPIQQTQEGIVNSEFQELEHGSEESDIIAEYSAESESDSESEILERIPEPKLGMIEPNDSSDLSQEDLDCTKMDSDSEDLSTLHEMSENFTRNNASIRNILVTEPSNSDEFQTPESSPVPFSSEFSDNIEKTKHYDSETELTVANNEIIDREEASKIFKGEQTFGTGEDHMGQPESYTTASSGSPEKENASHEPSNFFDFHKNDFFDRFLNDNQAEVPPRGDVAVVGDKIRKHERSASSITSFNSILHNEFESPNKTNALFSRSPIQKSSPRTSHSKSPSFEKLLDVEHKNRIPILEKALPITPTDDKFTVDKDLPAEPNDKPVPSFLLQHEKCFDDSEAKGLVPVQESENLPHNLQLGSTLKCTTIDNNNIVAANGPASKKNSMLDVVELKMPRKKSSNLSHQISDKTPTNLTSCNEIPKAKSFNSLNGDSKLKKSSSTANFKAFLKKLFPLPSSSSPSSSNTLERKSMHNSQGSQIDTPQETSSLNRFRKLNKGKRSFSFTNLKLPGTGGNKSTQNESKKEQKSKLTTLPKVDEAKPVLDQNDLDDEIVPENEKLTITKLPTIERDDGLFEDMFTNFDEKFNNANSTPNKISTNSINELFIKDDELTRDQIEDQQKRDNNQVSDGIDEDHDSNSTSPDAFSMTNSDEIYIDDNIRFLQDELVWPIDNDEFKSIEDYSVLSRSGTMKTKLYPESNEEQGESTVETIVVDNEQLAGLFDNLSELQRRRLPIHLKHIGQFKDSKILEISIRNFESIPDLSNLRIENRQLNSILKNLLKAPHNKKVQFSNKIFINETFSPDMYKRYNKSVTQYTLTESMEINKIKNELNTYKCNEMLVHEHSQNNTHFFY